MNLIIDKGNTRTKIGIFKDCEIVFVESYNKIQKSILNKLYEEYNFKNIIICSTSDIDNDLKNYLKDNSKCFIEFNTSITVPIEILYKSINTLGPDRIAAVIGAKTIYPKSNILVIDAGTAITYEFLNEKEQYVGGNISPGLEMRFKSLNYYTKKLPLVNQKDVFTFIGQSTEEAIVNGVQNGLIFEIESYINIFRRKYDNLRIIMTGGDALFFAKKLKNPIFVDENLVLKGLNNILDFNLNK